MTTLAEKKGFIWFDGKIVNSEEANVHVLTHTLHYGLGVFEGVRAYETPEGTKIFRLNDHTDRLFSSAQAVDLEIPFSKEEINQAQIEIVKLNDYFINQFNKFNKIKFGKRKLKQIIIQTSLVIKMINNKAKDGDLS